MQEAMSPAKEAVSESVTRWVEGAATGIEVLAVAIVVAVIAIGTIVYLYRILTRQATVTTYRAYRHQVARALLLGLEILVAADVIRTVALTPTIQTISILGLLVLIRTFLGWSLVVEIEKRWPWQPERREADEPAADAGSQDSSRGEDRV